MLALQVATSRGVTESLVSGAVGISLCCGYQALERYTLSALKTEFASSGGFGVGVASTRGGLYQAVPSSNTAEIPARSTSSP